MGVHPSGVCEESDHDHGDHDHDDNDHDGHGHFVQFDCNIDGTVTVLEHCQDSTCSECEIMNASLAQNECYMVDDTVHLVTCEGSNATVKVYEGNHLTCDSDLENMTHE